MPLDAPVGEFYVGVLLDVNDAVPEDDEANNGTATVSFPVMDLRPVPESIGGEFRINAYTAYDQHRVSVDADAAGNYVAVWEEPNSLGWGSQDIYLQRFNAEVTPMGRRQRVHDDWRGEQANPDVAEADEANNAYQTSFHEPTVNIAGFPMFGPEQQANTTTADEQSNPAVGFDAAGNYVAVWLSRNQDGDGYGVYGRRYDATGSPRGDEFQVNTTTDGDQMYPSVAAADDGSFAVVWQSRNQDGSGWGVYAQRYDAGGTPLGDEFQVNTYIDNSQYGPALVMNAAGDFTVAWDGYGQDGYGWGIFARRYAADGSPTGGEFRVNRETTLDQAGAAIAALGGEHFVVAWQSNGQDGSSWAVLTRLIGVSDEDSSPNLVVSQLSAPGTVNLGETIDLTLTVENSGMLVAPASTARLYLSDDNVFGNGGDQPTGVDVAIPQILFGSGNNTYQTTVQYTWPSTDPIGTGRNYFFILEADADAIVEEANEDDNTRASNQVHLGMPNLYGWVSVPSSIVPDEEFAIDVTIRNNGDATAGANIAHLSLSDDDVIGNAADVDLLIDIPVPELQPYGWPDYEQLQTTVFYTWTDPGPIDTDGLYYFVLCADVADELVELDEEDNCDLDSFGVDRPNLIVSDLNAPSQVDPGEEITVSVEVLNTGSATADASTLHLGLSDDSIGGNGDDFDLLIDVSVPSLEVYGWPNYTTFTTPVTFTWPGVDPFGTDLRYFVVPQADAAGVIEEGNEGDVDGNGKTDLILMRDAGGLIVRTAFSNGDGTWHPYTDLNPVHTGYPQYPVLTGDVDGNGKTDLILMRYPGLNEGLLVRTVFSNGDGTWHPWPYALKDGDHFLQYPVLAGDVDGNGNTDLILMRYDGLETGIIVRTKFSNGTGTWGSYEYPRVVDDPPYVESTMPTAIHEKGIMSSFSEFDVIFSEWINRVDALESANSRLIRDAGDGSFGNAGDTFYTLEPDYNGSQRKVTLEILEAEGGFLPAGHYQLAISGSGINDLAGLRLDGDQDGTEGPDYVREFVVDAEDVAPTAHAGGPYSVVEGGAVVLDASGTTDPSPPIR